MNNVSTKKKRLSGDITACVENYPILLVKRYAEEWKKEYDYIKVKLHRNPAPDKYETFKYKSELFENRKPEEFLFFIWYLKKTLEATGTTSASGKIKFLYTFLRREDLYEFDRLVMATRSTTNRNL